MNYQVYYTDTVKTDIAAKVDHLRDQQLSERFIEQWFNALFDAVETL